MSTELIESQKDASDRRVRLPSGPLAVMMPADPRDGSIPSGAPEQEATAGSEHYLATLARIHETLRPELYVEIGVREGESLRLARGHAIGIDPATQLRSPQPPAALYHETSDIFFERDAGAAIVKPVNLAFIDGLHLFEYAFRDFVNLEQRAASSGLIVLDDIFPNHPDQGSRHRNTRVWTGDVWRLLICLAEQRPDLITLPLDCAPTGLLLVAGLNPCSRILGDRYNEIVRRYLFELPLDPPPALIARRGALDPSDPLVGELLEGLRRLADQNAPAAAVRSFADELGRRYRYHSIP